MRILIIGINYAPERTAVAPFTTGLCEHLASSGHDVTVITAFPYYPEWRVWDGYRGQFFRREVVNGISVRRVWHFVPRRPSSLIQRLAHDFSYAMSAFLAGLFVGPYDIIYCSSPPPAAALSAYLLSGLKRIPYVIKLTDLASDAALATGIVKDGFKVGTARAIERFVYDGSEEIICLCQGFIDKLKKRGIDPAKLHLITDWADTENIRPLAEESAFRRDSGVAEGQLLILHTGNIGKKQELLNMVRAADLARDRTDLVWMLIGHGEERGLIEEEIRRRNLHNFRLMDLQPAKLLPQIYAAADVLVLNQKAAVEDAVIPSKLLTYMAAGRPVVAAVSDTSESARYIRAAKCGLVAPPGDPAALLQGILELRQNLRLRKEMGLNGRTYAESHLTKAKVLQCYDAFFRTWSGNVKQHGLKKEASLIAE
jgi:colanic acid biosynthesis glycosyl transferase WcaI